MAIGIRLELKEHEEVIDLRCLRMNFDSIKHWLAEGNMEMVQFNITQGLESCDDMLEGRKTDFVKFPTYPEGEKED